MSDTKWVAMGYIKGAFGIKGWVKVAASTEYADSLLDYADWRLVKDNKTLIVSPSEGQLHNGELQVKLTGIDDRDEAHALRGYTIEVSRDQFADTEEDEYYWADLIDMSVINRQEEILGKVSKLMETGAHDVLVVDGQYGQKLIPFVAQFIDRVDVENRTITVDWGSDY